MASGISQRERSVRANRDMSCDGGGGGGGVGGRGRDQHCIRPRVWKNLVSVLVRQYYLESSYQE